MGCNRWITEYNKIYIKAYVEENKTNIKLAMSALFLPCCVITTKL